MYKQTAPNSENVLWNLLAALVGKTPHHWKAGKHQKTFLQPKNHMPNLLRKTIQKVQPGSKREVFCLFSIKGGKKARNSSYLAVTGIMKLGHALWSRMQKNTRKCSMGLWMSTKRLIFTCFCMCVLEAAFPELPGENSLFKEWKTACGYSSEPECWSHAGCQNCSISSDLYQ